MNSVHFMSKKSDWETPQDLFNRLNDEFHFTLDAAASDLNHKLPHYYTEKEDGLAQDWGGGTGILQSSLWEQGNRIMDREMLERGAKARHACCSPYSRQN